MSSEKNRVNLIPSLQSKIKHNNRDVKKALEIIDLSSVSKKERISIIDSFLDRVSMMVDRDENVRYEALNFIQQNQPRDIAEVYQLLNMFAIQEMSKVCMLQINGSITGDVIKEYIKIGAKLSNEYSKGMVALKTYRTKPNIIRNQNNTLNQMNINNSIPSKND